MIGLYVMRHEEGRQFLTNARASRAAQADADGYRQVMTEESTLLGLA